MADIRFRLNGEDASIDLDKLMFAEARAIEKVTGKTFKEIGQALQDGSMEAMQALVWVTFKRSKPGLKFSDFDDVAISDVEMPDDELPDDEGVESVADPTPAGVSPAGSSL